MSDLIKHLKSFNRKERYWLLREAVGDGAFNLSEDFRMRLEKHIGITVPENAFVAMDYHLDWLYVALQAEQNEFKPFAKKPQYIDWKRPYKGVQTDIDLIVAFPDGKTTQLVLVEAKGDTSWDNPQLSHKAHRLNEILGNEIDHKRKRIRPHFILMSPATSKNIKWKEWPRQAQWMHRDGKPHWIELRPNQELFKITRVDESGSSSSGGNNLKIHRVTWQSASLNPVACDCDSNP